MVKAHIKIRLQTWCNTILVTYITTLISFKGQTRRHGKSSQSYIHLRQRKQLATMSGFQVVPVVREIVSWAKQERGHKTLGRQRQRQGRDICARPRPPHKTLPFLVHLSSQETLTLTNVLFVKVKSTVLCYFYQVYRLRYIFPNTNCRKMVIRLTALQTQLSILDNKGIFRRASRANQSPPFYMFTTHKPVTSRVG